MAETQPRLWYDVVLTPRFYKYAKALERDQKYGYNATYCACLAVYPTEQYYYSYVVSSFYRERKNAVLFFLLQ